MVLHNLLPQTYLWVDNIMEVKKIKPTSRFGFYNTTEHQQQQQNNNIASCEWGSCKRCLSPAINYLYYSYVSLPSHDIHLENHEPSTSCNYYEHPIVHQQTSNSSVSIHLFSIITFPSSPITLGSSSSPPTHDHL